MQEPQEMWVWSLGGEDALEKSIATHSSILVWGIPWTEEPGATVYRGPKSWTRLKQLSMHTHTHTRGTCWRLAHWNLPEIHPWACWGELLTRKCLTRGTLQQNHLRDFPGQLLATMCCWLKYIGRAWHWAALHTAEGMCCGSCPCFRNWSPQ